MKDEVKAIVTDPVLQQRLAKYLVLRCFRNSVVEDLHAGTAPSSKSGDYSDVEISTPLGAIPWNAASRFDDAEMKVLMIDVVNRRWRIRTFQRVWPSPCSLAHSSVMSPVKRLLLL
ncbi:MAG: hypothetical protein HY525_04745 [Betaproteobacteria bacterium]|nr:hypothetical protein [Betaproteobacteria bacterium]